MAERRLVRAAVTAGVLLVMSACGGIPSGGEVTPVKRVVDPGGDERLDQPGVRRLVPDPKAPVDGATPIDIIRGFFEAHAAEDHDTARLFLAANATWSDRGAMVYTGELRVTQVKASGVQGSAVVTVRRDAVLNAAGEYKPEAPKDVALAVTLQREAANWRLSRVPQGLVLDRGEFGSSFSRVTLYHPDPRREHLVPDLVFLPGSKPAVSDVLDTLLRGPSEWLKRAVRTVVPQGTRVLGTPRVGVNGVADVDLSLEANATAREARPALAAQIVRTLTEAGLGVTGVRLRVEGRDLEIPGSGSGDVMTRATWSEFEPILRPSDERLFFVDDGDLQALDSESQSVVSTVAGGAYLRVAVSRRGGILAATQRRSDGRQVLVVGRIGETPRHTVEGDELSTPSWNRSSDLVWVVRRNGTTTDVVAVPADVEVERRVRVDGALGAVRDLRLSPDGNRAMLVIGDGKQRRLYAARVESSPSLLALTGLRPVAPTLSDVAAVAWHSDRGVQVVATRRAEGDTSAVRSIFRLDVDGFDLTGDDSELDGLPRAPDAIAAAPTRVTAVAVAGVVYKKSPAPNSRWTQVGPGAAPAYAG